MFGLVNALTNADPLPQYQRTIDLPAAQAYFPISKLDQYDEMTVFAKWNDRRRERRAKTARPVYVEKPPIHAMNNSKRYV